MTAGSATPTLTITNGGSFSGTLNSTGALAINLTGGTLTLSGANTYSGATQISGATLTAGYDNAFSPNSDYTLTSGTMNLDGHLITIKSLVGNGSSSVDIGTLGLLTINGGSTTTFAGTITNSGNGGLTISGGTALTLSGTSTYSGPTLIEDGTLIISATTALAPLTDVTIASGSTLDITVAANTQASVSANSITNSGTLDTAIQINLGDTFTQNSGGTFNISFDADNYPANAFVNATGDLTVSGTLHVTNNGSTQPNSGVYTLLAGDDLVGDFTTYLSSGFTNTPDFSTSLNSVYMYFAGCANTWVSEDGNWGNLSKWNNGFCVPGTHGNATDTATFGTGQTGNILVTLSSSNGSAALPVVLYQLTFNTANASYTIDQYSNVSTITLNSETESAVPQIVVSAGQHTINAPIILSLASDIVLTDGTTLTFGSDTTLTSNTTETLEIGQSNGSTEGSGILVNQGSITPYEFVMYSATIDNQNTCVATNEMNIVPLTGYIATVTNSGANAAMGTSGADSTMTIGGAGTTTITNNGIGAFIGVSNSGGHLIVDGENTTILNSGLSVLFGVTGSSGEVEFRGGTLTNESGATVRAGSGGTIEITGGTLINDVTSTIGASNEDLLFSSGLLNTTGDVEVSNYTQSGTAILQVNFNDLSTQYGNVAASGIATVGSNLVVDALDNSFTAGQVFNLVSGEGGLFGTYSHVDFLNFPVGVIPNVLYTSNAVQLTTSGTVTSNPVGSVAALPFAFANQTNIYLQRNMHTLHGNLRKRAQKEQTAVSYQAVEKINKESKGELEFIKVAQTTTQTTREQRLLAERVQEKMPNASRFYFGPIDSFGSFSNQGTSQAGFDFNSIGIYTGIDHAFDNCGVGGNLEYAYTKGHVDHDAGKMRVNQIQGTGYATFILPALNQLAFDVLLGYGYEWFSLYRVAGPAVSPVIAKGTPQGMYVDGLVGVEYVFENRQFSKVPENFMCTPFFNMQYIWTRVGQYDEKGAGVYDLHVDSQRAQSLRSTLGARLEYVVTRKNFVFKPELDLAWQYEYLDHNRNINFSTLNASAFQSISTPVVGSGRNTVLIGVDFLFTIHSVFELEISYDFQWNDHYMDNTFYLGIGGNF